MKIIKVLAALLLSAPFVAHAQVKASLVAADLSVQPGKPLTAAIRLDHEPHWHTYWINAGTGYPTTIKWDLPPGWSAGDIQWPTPIKIKDAHGAVTGNGFDGVTSLPVILTPAAAAKSTPVILGGRVKWLMCADVCIPGEQTISLTLPVFSEAPKPNAGVRADLAKMSMPMTAANGSRVAAERGPKTVTLKIAGQGKLTAPHFFSEDAFIQYDLPQTLTVKGGAVNLRLPIAEDADPATNKLIGVLAYTDEGGVYRGVKVDVPFGADGASAGAVESLNGGSGPSGTARASLFVTLLLALMGGLILNLMPCVFPVLGIKVVGFVNQSGNDRRKISLHGLTFTLGVLLSFWALAAALAILRASGEQLGWGFQLQSPVFVYGLAVIMLVFALSLSGVFEFGLSAIGAGSSLQMKDGYIGSFFTGVLATVVATPCSAPFLAPALGATLALPTVQSFAVFTAIAIGLSLPYLLLSIFPEAIKILPKPGRWMETFKQVMAFPLYATVGFLLWVLAGQISEGGLLSALLGLTVIALGVWVYGRYVTFDGSAGRRRFGWAGGAVLLIAGLSMGWPRAAAPTDIVWEPWSTQRVEALREEGRPIYVDFTARWCATCQANKKVVFGSDEVKKALRDRNVAMLKADWTNRDDTITRELARWNRKAIPFNLIYLPGRAEPKALPEVLTPGIVLEALRS